MSDYDDLFKDFDQKTPVSNYQNQIVANAPAPETDEEIEQPKRNRRMLLIYIILTLIVSIGSTLILYLKYDGINGVVNNLIITEEISISVAPSTDLELPYEFRMTGAIRNQNQVKLPIVYVEYTFYDASDNVLGTYAVEMKDVEPGALFTYDETVLFAYDFVESEYAYGFDESSGYYLGVNLLQVALAGILFIVIDKRAFRSDGKKVLRKPGKAIGEAVLGFVMVWAAMILSQLFMQYILGVEITSENESTIASMFVSDPLQLVLLFLLLCVFTPIVEEIIFRKVLCGYFERKLGRIWAIVLSGVVFGLMHVISYGDFVQSIPYVAMGAVFGYIYFRSDKNIYVPITVHFLNNLISYLMYLLPLLGYSLL